MMVGLGKAWLAMGVLLGAPAAAAQGEAASATPTGNWTVDFAAQRCVAMREYSTPAGPLILVLEPAADGFGTRLVFRVPQRRGEAFGWHRGRLSVNGTPVSEDLTIWPAPKNGLLITAAWGGNGEAGTKLSELRTIELASRRLSVALAPTGVVKLAAVLDECNRDLLTSWGLSPADQERLANWPRLTNFAKVLDATDYPPAALRGFQQGDVWVRVQVGADGAVKDCVVRNGSGYPALDGATCEAMRKRGKFSPALDKAGQPMEAPALVTVRWRIPTMPDGIL